jgi:hypothetical protein
MHDADSSSILGNNVSDYFLSSYWASEIFEGGDIDVQLDLLWASFRRDKSSMPVEDRRNFQGTSDVGG